MKNNFCLHIQTTPSHFKYVYNFLESASKNIRNIENVPIYIIFDKSEEAEEFNKNLSSNLSIRALLMEEIVDSANLLIKESYENCLNPKDNLPIKWGAGGHRDYVAVKRSYSILALGNLGFKHVWCLDSESYILKSFDINEFIDKNLQKPSLLIGSGISGVRYPFLFDNLFGWNIGKTHPLRNINIRMNDFWIINTDYFQKMIEELQGFHKKGISYFMNGSEQSLYEYYLFKSIYEDKINLEPINIFGDMHGNRLFYDSYVKPKTNLSELAKFMNDYYFDLTNSYRGDYINSMQKNDRGRKLLELLNIKVAVSNYQGF